MVRSFLLTPKRINERSLERQSLSAGLRLRGAIDNDISVEANINQFFILKDESASSAVNPNDPAFKGDGQISKYDDSGWQTAEIKVSFDNFITDSLELITGLRHENYELNLDVYKSPDYRAGIKAEAKSRFGGKTAINAAFVQANWSVSDTFDLALGLRYEQFESSDGYYSEQQALESGLALVHAPSVEQNKLSPKFSVGYRPVDDWLVRYSFGQAYRFPVVEELFRQYQAYNTISEANPDLKAEDGTHHNIMIDRYIDGGYIRVNVFHERINNAIESQSTTIVGGANDGVSVRTFVPIDETQATGVEFIVNQQGMWNEDLDIRFNLTYTDATIEKNASNPDWQGNKYPRMPKWRSNLLATYHITDNFNVAANAQYASNSYGRLQNDDHVSQVYGAQDSYTRIGVKTNYQFSEQLRASIGVDNISNEVAYVAHPWPGRTFYLNLSYKL